MISPGRRGSSISVEDCGRKEHKFEGTGAAEEVQERHIQRTPVQMSSGVVVTFTAVAAQ